MPEITAITPQVKDKDRCNIYVDGRFYCGLKLETALAHRLKAGQQVDLAELDAIQVNGDGGFEFWFNDGELLWDDAIRVSGTLSDGPTAAQMEG